MQNNRETLYVSSNPKKTTMADNLIQLDSRHMITFFKNIRSIKPFFNTIAFALQRIKNGNSKKLVEQIRKEPDKEVRDKLKEGLPCILFAGTFNNREDKSLQKHSSFCIIDFDHIKNAAELKEEVFKEPFVKATWISPSGDGVKALVKIKHSDRHRQHYKALLKHFESFSVSPDVKNINPARVCYESYDPAILCKGTVTEFELLIEEKEYTKVSIPETNEDKIYAKLKKWASNKGELFVDGNRNSFLMKMAAACNRTGITKESALAYLASDYLHGTNFSIKELQGVVNKVYKNYAGQHKIACFKDTVNVKKDAEPDVTITEETFACDMPVKDLIYFKDVYENMEERLRNGINKGETTHFPILDNHFRWMRREVTIFNGYGNQGKTSMLLQLLLFQSVFKNYKWAIFNPENSPADFFYQDVAESYAGKQFDKHFPGSATDEEREKAKEFVNNHFFYIYPKDDMPTPDYVLKRFMETIIKHKVDGVIIDPYNQLTHDRNGRDDIYLETFLNNVKRFAQNNDIFFIIVTHPNKPTRIFNKQQGSEKIYEEPTAYDLHGGAMWNNKPDNLLCYNRPNYFLDPTDAWCTFSSQRIKKQKLNGIPGKVNYIYDRFKCRFYEIDNEPTGDRDNIVGFNPLENMSEIKQIENKNYYETDYQF